MRVAWVPHRRMTWIGAIEAFQPTGTLDDIVPEFRPKFEALVAYAKSLGMTIKVRSAGRTCMKQAELYDAGETVTQANLCRSMHVFGHAADFDVTPNTCDSYTKLGTWWEQQGGVWGGRWKQFGPCGDQGHFHIGMNGAQAVPTSLCPANVGAEECRAIRENYLSKAFGQPSSLGTGGSRMGILSGLLIVGAAAALLYATVNVRAPVRVRENPSRRQLSESEEQYIGHIHADMLMDQWGGEQYAREYKDFDEAWGSHRENVAETVYEQGGNSQSVENAKYWFEERLENHYGVWFDKKTWKYQPPKRTRRRS